SAAHSFPDANLTTADVISSFAGLRPLAGGVGATKELSRREVIIETKSGLISIIGGKLTTWRAMAERAVDLAVKRLAANAPASSNRLIHSRSAEMKITKSGRYTDPITSDAERLADE